MCAAFAAASIVALGARAGGENVAFPKDFGTLYATVDRADNKQYRELYASPAALEAMQKGQSIPSGTVLTLIQYAAKLDEKGEPIKDANGRFVKDRILAYNVMEKRTGWGVEYPASKRNGEWEYQAFLADKTVNIKANLDNCFKCHLPMDKQDYVISYDRMKNPVR